MTSRRSFLKAVLAASSLSVTKCFGLESTVDSGNLDYLTSLYESWTNHYEQTPESYLASLGNEIKDPSFYKSKIKHDFLIDDVFEFDGVILSKTEAAGISTLLTL